MNEGELVTAVHEAGHIVVAYLEKFILVKLSMKQDQDSFGRAHLKFPEAFDKSQDLWIHRHCHIALAGACAEAIHRGTDPRQSRKFDDEDWEPVEEYARQTHPDDKHAQKQFVENRLSVTMRLLNDVKIWNAIVEVADKALKSDTRELYEIEIVSTVDRHFGTVS